LGSPEEEIRVVDFGSVADKLYEEYQTITSIGTFGFAPTECLYGHPTPASDIYSLGATLIWLLSGGKDPTKMMNSDHRIEFKGKLNISRKLENILLDMTELDQSRRMSDTEELKQRLYGGSLVSLSNYSMNRVVASKKEVTEYKSICEDKHFEKTNSLKEILNIFSNILNDLENVTDDYGTKFEMKPIEIKLDIDGLKTMLHDPKEVLRILPTKEAQINGIANVDYYLKKQPKNKKAKTLEGWIEYHSPYDDAHLQVSIIPKNFTVDDQEEYYRLREVIRNHFPKEEGLALSHGPGMLYCGAIKGSKELFFYKSIHRIYKILNKI